MRDSPANTKDLLDSRSVVHHLPKRDLLGRGSFVSACPYHSAYTRSCVRPMAGYAHGRVGERETSQGKRSLGQDARGFWVCGAGETLAEAACPPIPHAHRTQGKRCAQGNHVSCLRRGLHLIGSWVEYVSRTVRHRGSIDQGKSNGLALPHEPHPPQLDTVSATSMIVISSVIS
jgi:hypothetical protein